MSHYLFTASILFIGLAKLVSADGLFLGCYSTSPGFITGDDIKGQATSGKDCAALCTGYTYSYLAYTNLCACSNEFVSGNSLRSGKEDTCVTSGSFEVNIVKTTFDMTTCSGEQDFQSSDFKGLDEINSPTDCLISCKGYQRAFLYIPGTTMYCGCANNGQGVSSDCSNQNIFIFNHPAPAAASELSRRNARELFAKNREERLSRTCPWGLTACKVPGLEKNDAWECVDVQNELESCGGCMNGHYNNATAAVGENCMKPGVKLGAATCSAGRCIISECKIGFKLVDNQCITQN